MSNIVTALIATAYIGGAGLGASEAIGFAKDYSRMNQAMLKTLKTGSVDMNENAEIMQKVCVQSALVFSIQGYSGTRCDVKNGGVKL